MTIEARELYCYCIGTHGQRFSKEAIDYGEFWVRGIVRGCAAQYVYDFCTKGTSISDIWSDDDIVEVVGQIIAERR